MHIYEFINLIQNSFASQVQKDPDTGRISAKLIYQDVITWFTDESLIDNDELNKITMKTPNYCEKLLNESNEIDMPINDAKLLKGKITSRNFKPIFRAAGLTNESKQLLIDGFVKKGYKLKGVNLPQELTDIFAQLLQERSEINKKASITKAQFISDSQVKIGGKIINLPPALYVPELPQEKENEYVTALLSVFSQKTAKKIMSIDDLDEFPIYQTEIQIHREYFYSAESVLHKVRKFFYDAENEFGTLKNEIFDSIRLDISRSYPDGYEKLQKTMDKVVVITLSKSYFSKPGNGIVGNGEKLGVVHMLVNDGKVRWI
ncbi:MAG: hypothetical protein BWY38_03124 [Ignavibacteria bacterium ADurb.Bin266]|nr:MAG: hypothetical protein BWY38_03124 [Ignavibacteria bacterium ADurb.Bin266]